MRYTRRQQYALAIILASLLTSSPGRLEAQTNVRARELGVQFDGNPGPLNAITDITGVEVGHTTIINGVPVGKEIPGHLPVRGSDTQPNGSSIIVVIATDAPLVPVQLDRIAKRAALGISRTGSIAMNFSGDIFLAFSTGNQFEPGAEGIRHLEMVTDINPLFEATVQATEEAVINALVAGKTMTGINGNTVYGLPLDRLQEILKEYGRAR